MSLTTYRKKIDAALSLHRQVRKDLRQSRIDCEEQSCLLEDANTAAGIVRDVAEAVQNKAHTRVAAIVTRCLAAVFDDAYEFHVIFDQKRGRTEARLVFVKDGENIDPLTSSGGGAVDVAAFALRLACLVLSRPATRPTLLLDEPLKFLSADYRPTMRALIDELAAELGVQIIMVTHLEELVTGHVEKIS